MTLIGGHETPRDRKSAAAFRTISEVAAILDVPQHVLRFWESKFVQVKPMKRGGGRRYYRPTDVELLRTIRALLYDDGYTIKGVQKLLRDGVVKPDGEIVAGIETPPDATATEQVSMSADEERNSVVLSSQDRQDLEAVLDELQDMKKTLDAALNSK
jgi:DNA-binding transcriptional MerR regulator